MMKRLTFLIALMLIVSLASGYINDSENDSGADMILARRGGGRGGHRGHGGRGGQSSSQGNSGSRERFSSTRFLQAANQTVQAIINAESTSAGSVYLFDLQPLIVRFYELNTTRIRSIWNATGAFLNNQTNFTWATLPADVQAALSDMKDTNAFINLPLSDLGLVSTSDVNANKTIYTMLSSNCQSLANTLINMTSGLHFNTTIDLNVLYSSFASMRSLFAYQYQGQRSLHQTFARHHGHWQRQPPASPMAQLYAYLSNPSANRNCLLSDPMNALNELVENCQ